ncbi:hypothetical protein [Clostridium sp.]|uniref:hypothetical protein n=1 Tax=Clostridium sp. TaxID=1506 RepID=UPI003D6D8DC7
MEILKMLGQGILSYIGTVIFAVVISLTAMFGYMSLQLILFKNGDYLLFISSNLNIIPIIMIIILFVYLSFVIRDKFFEKKEKQLEIIEDEEDEEPLDIETLSKLERFFFKLFIKLTDKVIALDDAFYNKIAKAFKILKSLFVLILIIAIYCSMTSYGILYTDSVKISSPLSPKGIIYKYNDIKSINVGIADVYKNSYEPYYKIFFNNNKSIDLIGGGVQDESDIDSEDVLINLDEKLRMHGVIKSVNKNNFKEYSKELDKDYINKLERLFNDK